MCAVAKKHLCHFDEEIRSVFADSIDLDAALCADHPSEKRWDYLLGHASTQRVVAIEAHPAKTNEVSVVIAKKSAALDQLKVHLRPGANVKGWQWLWVASSGIKILKMSSEWRALQRAGIHCVGKVCSKDLPSRQ
jgi:hypothetical protein